MPAKSEAQQKAAGMALAAKRGEMDVDELQGAAKDMYDSMTEDELEDFAETEHKGLPTKKENKMKKMNEEVDQKYKLQFAEELYRKLKGRSIGSWEMDYDRMSGSLYFYLKGDNDFQVYATPFWEGENSIPVDIQVTGGGRDRYDHITDIAFAGSGNFDTDMKLYLKKMVPVLNKIKRSKDKYT